MEKQGYLKTDNKCIIRTPKDIARIKICGGALTFTITDMCEFTPPTEEQRKNLKEMLCIDVEMLEE